MLYKDDVPNVEIGVEARAAFAAIGRVVPSSLPAGHVATTMHRGPYDGIGAAHEAVITWCDGRGLRRTGARWEIYGHFTPDVAAQTVEIHYLLGRGIGAVTAGRAGTPFALPHNARYLWSL